MQDKPSLLLSGILLIASGISAILAGRIHGDDLAWLKLIFILLACVTGFYGLLYLVGWIVWTAIDARAEAARVTREMSEARYPVVLAHALANLPDSTTALINRSTIMEVLGMIDDSLDFEWRIRAPGTDVDWDFAVAFTKASNGTKPYLWPVNKAYELGDYPNAEDQAASLTTLLVTAGWADPAAGNRSARLTVPWRQLAGKFGIDE